jgi:hypothetical protein
VATAWGDAAAQPVAAAPMVGELRPMTGRRRDRSGSYSKELDGDSSGLECRGTSVERNGDPSRKESSDRGGVAGRGGAGPSAGGFKTRSDLIQTDLKIFKLILNSFKLYLIQIGLSQGQFFKIKYVFEDPKKLNNFLHRNFFRFEMCFEFKFGEVKVCF